MQFLQDTRSESLVYNVVGVVADNARSVHLHSFPLPVFQAEHLEIKLIGESLGPCRKFLSKVLVKNGLKGKSVSDFLVASGFIDKGDNADMSKPTDD